MEANSQEHREYLRSQLKESYGRIVYTYTAHWKMVDALVKKNKRIKYAQIALSAISTGGFIGSILTNESALTCVGGIFSTVLLGINLYFKDFNLGAESAQHTAAANALWNVRESYISLLTDFLSMSTEDICAKRDTLQAQVAEIYKSAPKTDARSYAAAQNALKNEEEQFFTVDELNQLLPEHLRVSK